MTLEEARSKLSVALADPRRRQLAHIAILDIAMGVQQALEGAGRSADIEETTEGISAYLSGDADSPPAAAGPAGALAGVVAEAIQETRQKPAFAGLFG